jgi:transcriptional regulator NrdR family protein
MKCPRCDSNKSGIIESRKRVDHVWRRRRCYDCNHIYQTMEIPQTTYLRLVQATRETTPRNGNAH